LDLGFATLPENEKKLSSCVWPRVLRLRRRVLNSAMAAFAFGSEKCHENFVRVDNVLAEISLVQKSLDPACFVIQD